MKKIPTVFERDWDGDRSRVLDEIHPGCEWVINGEGVATRKYDGTPAMVKDGELFKRLEVKAGQDDPDGFIAEALDIDSGNKIGWVPVGDGPEDRWFRDAYANNPGLPDGTYELLGPKVQGNPEGFDTHTLLAHSAAREVDAPRTYDELARWFVGRDIEGIVWHHPDGRMAKIKGRDFGVRRAVGIGQHA